MNDALIESAKEIEAMRAQIDVLTKERDIALDSMDAGWNEVAASQAREKVLQEALNQMEGCAAYASHDDSVGYRVCCQVASYKPHRKDCFLKNALALPQDTSALDARLAEERIRCMQVCCDSCSDYIGSLT